MRLGNVARPGEILKLSKGDIVSAASGVSISTGSPNECKGSFGLAVVLESLAALICFGQRFLSA